MTKTDLTAAIKAAGFSYHPNGDAAVQAAALDGMSLEDVRDAGKGLVAMRALDESFRAALDGGRARQLKDEADERNARRLAAKREREIADATRTNRPTVRRRITADDPSMLGSSYLGHEGEWADMQF